MQSIDWKLRGKWEMLRQGDRWISGILYFLFHLGIKDMEENDKKSTISCG